MFFPALSKLFSGSFLVLLCMTLYVGVGSSIFSTEDPRVNPVGFTIYILCVIYLYRNIPKVNFNLLFTPGLFLMVWCLFHYFIDSSFQYVSYFQMILYFFTSFLIVQYYRDTLLDSLEDVLYFLAVVGFLFWIINIVIGPDFLRSLAPFDSSFSNQMHTQSGSFLVYTIGVPGVGTTALQGIIRNYGFCWEPGRYASLLVVGLTLYLIRIKGFVSIKDVHLLFYILCIISTFSTTGYVAVLIIFFLIYLFSKDFSWIKKFFFLLFFIVTLPAFLSLDFMGEKITNQSSKESFTENQNMEWLDESERFYTVDRFEGLYLDYKNLLASPFFGYGLSVSDTYVFKNISRKLITSNGILKPLAQFGLILGFFLFLSLWRSSRLLSLHYSSSPFFLFFISFLTISISYNFFFNALFLSLVFYSYFLLDKENILYE